MLEATFIKSIASKAIPNFPIPIDNLRFNKYPNLNELMEWGRRDLATGLKLLGHYETKVFMIRDNGLHIPDVQVLKMNVDKLMDPNKNKEFSWDFIKGAVRRLGSSMCMVVSEIWMQKGLPGMTLEDLGGDLSKSDMSSEGGLISAETRTEAKCETYNIIRLRGGKPRLGELIRYPAEATWDMSASRMASILYGQPEWVPPIVNNVKVN